MKPFLSARALDHDREGRDRPRSWIVVASPGRSVLSRSSQKRAGRQRYEPRHPLLQETGKSNVLAWLRQNAQDRLRAVDLYGAVVAEARRPAFFTDHGVLDTPEGRAGLVILMLFPVLEQLQSGSPRARRFARYVTETYVTDIDDCLREMGVGDMAVPKKVKRAAQALGERCHIYAVAAARPSPAEALAVELAATVPGLDVAPAGTKVLARFALDVRDALKKVPENELLAGHLPLPAIPKRTEITTQALMETPR